MRRRLVLGIAASVAFCVAVMGSNVPGPLLPLYQQQLHMSAFSVASLFVTYFAALIAMFVTMSRSRFGRRPEVLLPLALLIGAAGDVALWSGADMVPLLFAGRLLTGICVGIATGAAATLAVVARGESGRTLAATGAILGSLLGLTASAAVAELFPRPTVLAYQLHAGLLLCSFVVLVAAVRVNRVLIVRELATAPLGGVGAVFAAKHQPDRRAFAGFALGAAGWTVGGIAVGVLPTAFSGSLTDSTLFVGILAALMLLLTAWLGPPVSRKLDVFLTAPQSLAAIGVGAVLVAGGLVADTLWLILCGSVLWGMGQGFAYAQGLLMLTYGLSAVDQGRRTSLYACSSYGFCAVLILLSGAFATWWGTATAAASICGLLVMWCALAAFIGRRRWGVPIPS